MIGLIQEHQKALEAICRQYHVRRLELFGSAASGAFDPLHSDVDFLVDFYPLAAGEHADCFFGLQEALQALLGRSVDLVMIRAIRNPYFLEGIAGQRELLYAA